jgi:hypothetical protein
MIFEGIPETDDAAICAAAKAAQEIMCGAPVRRGAFDWTFCDLHVYFGDGIGVEAWANALLTAVQDLGKVTCTSLKTPSLVLHYKYA